MSKYSLAIQKKVHPLYVLGDNGIPFNFFTGVQRPRMDSDEAMVFQDGQKAKIVDMGAGFCPNEWKLGSIVTLRVLREDAGMNVVRVQTSEGYQAFMPGRFDPINEKQIMKNVIAIPFHRYMELAQQAGHKNEMPFGPENHVNLTDQLNYIKFAHAIGCELATKSIDLIDLERIAEIARADGGFAPREPESFPTAKEQASQMLHISQQELFYTRFAYAIAAELAKE